MEADDDFRVPTVGSSQRVPVQTNHSYREQAADNTCRPDYGPSTRPGTHFEPLNVPESPLIVRPLPSTLLKLFQLFLPETTVQQWVDYTNNQANAVTAVLLTAIPQGKRLVNNRNCSDHCSTQ
jgi:hypothetical protein